MYTASHSDSDVHCGERPWELTDVNVRKSHGNTITQKACTCSSTSLTCPSVQAGYGSTYSDCEHATPEWKALTNPANTTSNAARANANKPCTACPSA